MVKRGLFFIVISLIFLAGLSSVAAAPPFTATTTNINGYTIFFPEFGVVPAGDSFNLHIHISNISNGMPLENDEADCFLHLYDITGNHTFESPVMTKDSNLYDHTVFITEGNFTEGLHGFYIWCNSTYLGGEAKGTFQITKLGIELDTPESLLYILLTIAVLGLFLLSLYFTIITPYSNKTDEKGAVIKITKLKYVKLGLILVSYVLFVWVLNVLIGVSDNFVSLTMYYGLVSFLFLTLNYLALPFAIFMLVLSGYEIVKDVNIYKIIEKFGSHK